MSQRELLRERTEQHKPKNANSKNEDKAIYQAALRVIEYIEQRFVAYLDGYHLEYEKSIQIKDIIHFIKRKTERTDFDERFIENRIIPDGGVIYLVKEKTDDKLPLVIAEVKWQGTNDKRLQEGKKKQATGNAIERLGKNLTGIKAMMHYEGIVPFVCFGQGCDFAETSVVVLAKVSVLNEFYQLNRIYVHKQDYTNKQSDGFSPTSMFFREQEWTETEMFDIMKEIAETAFRYYVF